MPSFSRQTGEACTACHVQTWGANLTPRGREFKLKGYTEGEGKWIPPLSVVAEGGGFLNLDDKNSVRDYFGRSLQPQDRSYFTGSVFYAGKIAGPVGAYVEGSYAHDPESGAGTGFLNKVDLRFANQVNVAGHQVDYGISVNNEPGVQDLWNTNAVWSPSGSLNPVAFYSFGSSPSGSELSWIAPLADRKLSGNVVGASMYALINKLLYVEAGGYTSLPSVVQRGIGRQQYYMWNVNSQGTTPYWRIALQHEWDGHYFSIGHFGLQADTVAANPIWLSDALSGGAILSDPNPPSFSDLGIDATYQYLANPEHILEFKGRYIRETVTTNNPTSVISTTTSLGGALIGVSGGNSHEITTESFNINGSYTWSQTLGLSVGYQQYTDAPITPHVVMNNRNYLTTELSYTPFGKQNSPAAPWANLRLSLAYVTTLNDLGFFKYVVPQESLYVSGRLAF